MKGTGKRVAILLGVLLFGLSLHPAGTGAAVMEDYCQVPPFVIQNVVPNIMIIVSNSASMLQFAYRPSGNLCDNASNPCWGFVDNMANPYYGYFDSRYWYTYGSNRFSPTAPKTGTGLTGARAKTTSEWDGNFLNWLTMRKTDVLRKVLTGGTVSGGVFGSQIADSAARGIYKRFRDNTNAWTPTTVPNNRDVTATFNTGGAATAPAFTLTASSPAYSSGALNVNVVALTGTPIEGVVQDTIGARARLGLTFFNSDNEGGNVSPPIGFTSLSSLVNRINTPSNINGGASAPLAETLWTVAGNFGRRDAYAGMGIAGSCVSGSNCGPRYHNVDYNISADNQDPHNYGSGLFPPCAKDFVVIITDGEPCGDGNLPANLADYASGRSSYNCTTTSCPAVGPFAGSMLLNWCGLGGNTAGLEDVALWSHTTDLRSATVGYNDIPRAQNLSTYIVQIFGSGSTLLRYAAINGGFEDANGSGTPDVATEWDGNSDGKPDTFYEATQGQELENALRDVFASILRRASSGTAASVLASGEGSGANLVQAVFYPRRRFGNEVITWTGSLQNLWYFTDPSLGNAAIHEDTDNNAILNLDPDYLAKFVYDTTTDQTRIQLWKTRANGSIDNTVSPVTIPFESARSLWEAGKLLYLRDRTTRRIFTVDNVNVPNPGTINFVTGSLASLTTSLDVPDVNGISGNTDETQGVISFVRGQDLFVDLNADGVNDLRWRTVNIGSDNTVWKLGDIVHSTPRISGGVPLNAYYKTYGDTTYKAFTDNAAYRSRGYVFAGGNDGMLHAFKLGKLEFDWTGIGSGDRARLSNIDNVSLPLGSEIWGYVPRNALPYLKYLTTADYCHLYYVDLSPFVFDASINGDADDVRTAASWRTVLIGGMRTGGAVRNATGSCIGGSDCTKTPLTGLGYSSYFAIDVTDATNPRVLWEFSDERLGYATTGPAVVRIHGRNPSTGNADRSRNGNWFVVVGSGPTGPVDNTYHQFLARSDQPLRFFVLDLKTGALRATIDNTGIANGFGGSMINAAADFDRDYQDDAVFMGYVKRDTATGIWNKGGVGRIATGEDRDPANWSFSKVIDDIGPVTSAVVRLQNDTYSTNWLFFGSGRYYYERGGEVDDASGQNMLFGVKDPCFRNGANLYPSCTSAALFSGLADQTVIDNSVTEGIASAAGFTGWYISLANDNAALVNYGDGGHYYHAERVITDPLSVSGTGTVFFTTYRPYNEACSLGGKSFIWATRYNTGGAPLARALMGKALIQVSTAAVEQLDLATAFSGPNSQGGRMSIAIEGVPPIAQGLSILTPPPPVSKVLHVLER